MLAPELMARPHLAYLVCTPRTLLLVSQSSTQAQAYPSASSTRAVGIIVCKTDSPLYGRKKRGYVAMLSIESGFRRKGIGEPFFICAWQAVIRHVERDETGQCVAAGRHAHATASHLARQCIIAMRDDEVREVSTTSELGHWPDHADNGQVVIETESDNSSSLALYEKLGFTRDKRLHRFYSNGKDAYVFSSCKQGPKVPCSCPAYD
jgi:peptide alpha-N-acetyltransferase